MLDDHSIPRAWRDHDRLIVMVLVLLTFVLLIGLRSATQTGDSLDYALSARTGEGMFHSHHLLYIPAVRLVYLGITPFCPACDTVLAAQIHNVAWAAVAIGATFFIVRRFYGSKIAGAVAALALLVCRGFWLIATQAEVYVPALGALALLTALLLAWENARITWPRTLVLALLFAIGVFYHQTNVLFAVPLAYWFLSGRQSQRRDDGYRALGATLSFAGIIVLATYVAAFGVSTNQDRTVSGFIEFNLTYVYRPNEWGALENVSPENVYKVVRSQLWNFGPFPRPSAPYVTGIVGSALALLAAWNARQALKRGPYWRLRGFSLLWVVTNFAFFLWWEPWQTEFFVITLFPIILLGFLAMSDINKSDAPFTLKQRVLPAMAGLIAIVFVINVSFKIVPPHLSKGYNYDMAAEAASLAPPECVAGLNWEEGNHLMYYFGGNTVEVTLVQLYFLKNWALPGEHELSRDECVLVPLHYVVPEDDGYDYPDGWTSYLGWLFDFEYDDAGEVTSAKDVKVMENHGENTFLLVGPGRMEVNSLFEFLDILDRQIDGHFAEKPRPFTSWYIAANLETSSSTSGDAA
jgi:hypothetical protein